MIDDAVVGDGSGLNNPYRLLKSVMDMLKERYTSKIYESLTFNEILSSVGREDIGVELSQWLEEALQSNPKIHFTTDSERYLFKPSLGLGVRNRRQLLELLKEWEREGKGGMMMNDVREAVYNPERAIRVSPSCHGWYISYLYYVPLHRITNRSLMKMDCCYE